MDLNGWPPENQRLATVSHVHAFGQIGLMYNLLEGMFGRLFESEMPVSGEAAKRLFHKLNNRDRVDILKDVIKHNEKDPDTSEAIFYCLNCYDICTQNRNILLHVLAEDDCSDGGLPGVTARFSKVASKNPNEILHFNLTVSEARTVAEDMSSCFNYMWRLHQYLLYRTSTPEDRVRFLLPRSLPKKPDKPKILTPHRPEEAHQA